MKINNMNKQIKWKWVVLDIYLVNWYRSVYFELEMDRGIFLGVNVPFMGFQLDICPANNTLHNEK
jgi:hypothetical protein